MMVVNHNDTYYMFAEGKYDIAYLLTSADGIHWTLHRAARHPTNQWPTDFRGTSRHADRLV